MNEKTKKRDRPKKYLLRRHKWLTLFCLICAFALYAANLTTNPPGFYVDESSIALNAHTISQSGTDEYGNRWPLFFRAFGEYKNPVYIYLLAGVFKLSGPGIGAARCLSATLGFITAMLLGWLALRLSGSRKIGVFVALTVILTPWLFEISRLVFEVALLPLSLTLFLLALHHAQAKSKWSVLDCVAIATTLALITYTYSTGRLLGLLLAVGLVFFVSRENWLSIIQTWLAYAVTCLPLLIFIQRNPGALTNRFKALTYIEPTSGLTEIASQFIIHYLNNLSLWSLLVSGDLNERHHVKGMGSILFPTLILAAAGAALALYNHWRDRWWLFVLYGLVVSVIPASLTKDDFHTLRLAAFPIFLILLMIPALMKLLANAGTSQAWRMALITLIGLTILQASLFHWQYQEEGRKRRYAFDAEYPNLLNAAIARFDGPIYLVDDSYAHAYWYGTLKGLDSSKFIREANPPAGAIVIGYQTDEKDPVLIERAPFVVYIAF